MSLTPETAASIQTSLQDTFARLGLNVKVAYRARFLDGLHDGFVFSDANNELLSKAGLMEKLDSLGAGFQKKGELGKLAWITSFKQTFFDNSFPAIFLPSDMVKNVAIVSEETATQAPFTKLLKNGATMQKLTPIEWDLSAEGVNPEKHGKHGKATISKTGMENLGKIATALTNIARTEGQDDIRFKVDGNGKIIFYSEKARLVETQGYWLDEKGHHRHDQLLSATELNAKVTGIIHGIVQRDETLAPHGQLAPGSIGFEVANKIAAFKPDRSYVAVDNQALNDPQYDSRYIVDLIENAQITSAAGYLNLTSGKTAQNGTAKRSQASKGRITLEDGDDIYHYVNRNENLLWRVNEEASVPGFSGKGRASTSIREHDLVDILNEGRGMMPVDMSEPLTPPPGKKPVVHGAHKHK